MKIFKGIISLLAICICGVYFIKLITTTKTNIIDTSTANYKAIEEKLTIFYEPYDKEISAFWYISINTNMIHYPETKSMICKFLEDDKITYGELEILTKEKNKILVNKLRSASE